MSRKKSSDVGKVETPKEKFVRLAQQRVSMALKYLGLVANLAGSGYERTSDQTDKIVTALETAVANVKDRFDGKTDSGGKFKL